MSDKPKRWTWEEVLKGLLQALGSGERHEEFEKAAEECFLANEPYIDYLEAQLDKHMDMLQKSTEKVTDLKTRIAELEGNAKVTPKRQKQDRLSSYKKVGEFLNLKGAPSNIWSDLEKLLEPNGIFLKQRETIKTLREALELIKVKTTKDPLCVAELNARAARVYDITETTLKECFGGENE